jgi:hypothetical protein
MRPKPFEARTKPIHRPAARWPARVLLGLLISLACSQAFAGTRWTGPEAIAGQWDFLLENSNRRCRLTLREDPSSSGGLAIGIPAGCRRSLPILATIEGWALRADDFLELTDRGGQVVLEFPVRDGNTFAAPGPQGQTYRLIAVALANGLRPAPKEAAIPQKTEPLKQPEPVKLAARTDPAAQLRPSDVAGHYAILRDGSRDTGCMLTLDDKIKARGGSKATLAPACRDQGIVIFDPVAWQLVNGRLKLLARKGHSTHLDRQQDGTWLKDPTEGKSLILKRL